MPRRYGVGAGEPGGSGPGVRVGVDAPGIRRTVDGPGAAVGDVAIELLGLAGVAVPAVGVGVLGTLGLLAGPTAALVVAPGAVTGAPTVTVTGVPSRPVYETGPGGVIGGGGGTMASRGEAMSLRLAMIR